MSFYETAKRIEDVILSLVFIAISSPAMIFTAIGVSASMGLPIIFKQRRAGKDNKPFNIYKFRSMKDSRDKNGDLIPESERVTKFGKFIRKSSLDELPQFFNVLKGDMSIVGPRPLHVEYERIYSPRHKLRVSVKPGITGYSQITTRSAHFKYSQKWDADVYYVEHRSFLFDNIIILKTFLTLLNWKASPSTQPISDIDDVGIRRLREEMKRKS